MPTLADLKAAFPAMCFLCGEPHNGLHCRMGANPMLTALIAKALEDEARIEVAHTNWKQAEIQLEDTNAKLTAEREAHEVTRKALEETTERLALVDDDSESINFVKSCRPVVARAKAVLAREAERQKGKVPDAD